MMSVHVIFVHVIFLVVSTSYENLANHWLTVLGLDVEPWRLLAVELLRFDRPIVSASCLEGIAAIVMLQKAHDSGWGG